MYQQTWSQTHHRHTHHRVNMICRLTEITENPRAINTIQRKRIRNTRNRTRKSHCREILIMPKTVTIDAKDAKNIATGKRILSNYAQS